MNQHDIQIVPEQYEQPSIYPLLAQHQRTEAWPRRELIALLQGWTETFIGEFKLDIPSVALCLDKLPSKCYGHFRYGYNGFGLRGEIAINSAYLPPKRQPWEILGTLLHELLHAWQQQHGTPGGRNHHNLEFRRKALEFGLVIDRRGVTSYAANSLFKDLLRANGVEVPPGYIAARADRLPAQSKLMKWSCGCNPPVNVRVAIADFQAMCFKCGTKFRRQGATVHPTAIEMFPDSEITPAMSLRAADSGGIV
jgi:hypothetical protein